MNYIANNQPGKVFGVPMVDEEPTPKRWIKHFECSNNDPTCGIQWTCDTCRARIARETDRGLTQGQLAYDDMMRSGGRCNDDD